MESNKPNPSCMLTTIDDLKASRREIQSQHSTLGLHISTLDARISTLESQLREYVGREIEVMHGVRTNGTQLDDLIKPSDGVPRINLKVTGMDGQDLYFKMKIYTEMEKLMNAWCDHLNLGFEDAEFYFKGDRLRADQTPQQLEMEDGAEISATLNMNGGISANA